MIRRLEQRTRDVPVVATCESAVEALHRFGVERIALVHPPWFDAELDALGSAYFEGRGFQVAFHATCDLPSSQQRIEPQQLYEWVRGHVPADSEAVFIGGNGFRAVGVIEPLEADLGRPVVTANQALLWGMLRAGGIAAKVDGYGSLFSARPASP
jgi:maleate isomerase